MAKVIGIDLGTTNSCVAVMEGGDLRLLLTKKALVLLLPLLVLQKMRTFSRSIG